MKKYVFGVDIGGTTIKLGLFRTDGILLEKWDIPTRKDNHGEQILPDVAHAILEKIKTALLDLGDIEGVGAGIASSIDKNGVTVGVAANLGWGTVDVPAALGSYLKLPVKAANDANVAALGEMWKGGGMGYHDLVMVTLGTGVGGGIILDGKIVVGATGGAGEIGHIHLNDDETEVCGCGNRGCLEQYASAPGIARLAERRLSKDTVPSILRGQKPGARAVIEAAKAGDQVAIEIMEQFGDYLGKGLAGIGAILNPEIYIIGGGISKAGEMLFDYLVPCYKKYSHAPSRDTKFALAKLQNDAGIYGAAALFCG